MMNKAYDLSTYAFSSKEPMLLDANVWLFLFPAPSDMSRGYVMEYSAAFKRMYAAGVYLPMDALILSEYLNRYCRIEWRALHSNSYNEFKTFRQSSDFGPVGQAAAEGARYILHFCTRHDHPFSTSDVDKVLGDFECGVCDFNDGLVIETCRSNGWKFVTHDADFTNGGIEVLTSNPRLLVACA
jgi:hypothetical protein